MCFLCPTPKGCVGIKIFIKSHIVIGGQNEIFTVVVHTTHAYLINANKSSIKHAALTVSYDSKYSAYSQYPSMHHIYEE